MSDPINRLLESMEKAGYHANKENAINTAIEHYEWIARRKELDRHVSQTVWGDVHIQEGIKMDIKLLEEALANQQNEYSGKTLTDWQKGYFWSSANSIALLKTQLKEFPWY